MDNLAAPHALISVVLVEYMVVSLLVLESLYVALVVLIFEVSHAGNLDAGLFELCGLLVVLTEAFVDLTAWLMQALVEFLFQQLVYKMGIKMENNYCPRSMIPVLASNI